MMGVLLVFLGGGTGSVLRFLIAGWLTPSEWQGAGPSFPYATLGINIVGCVVIGLIAGWCGKREWARTLLMVGLLGGFTTFSAFGLDTIRLMSAGHGMRAFWYVAISVGGGLLGAWLAIRGSGLASSGSA